jgi:type IV pilus modification protein PilV
MKNIKKSEEKKNREKGFTLIEVMVAIVILTVGLLAVGAMQISAIRGNSMGGNTSIALSLASEKMEDILNSSFDDPTGQPPKLTDQTTANNSNLSSTTSVDYDEYVSEDGAVVTGGFYRRIWNIANVPTTLPTTKNVMVIVSWENNKHRVSIASVKNQVVY